MCARKSLVKKSLTCRHRCAVLRIHYLMPPLQARINSQAQKSITETRPTLGGSMQCTQALDPKGVRCPCQIESHRHRADDLVGTRLAKICDRLSRACHRYYVGLISGSCTA